MSISITITISSNIFKAEETEKGWMVVTDGNPREVRVLPQTRAGRSYVPKVEDDSWEITGDYVTIQN